MKKPVSLEGKIFGRLIVKGVSKESKYGNKAWDCVCDCGNKKSIVTYSLTSGSTKSCGCLAKEVTSKAKKTHGMRGASIYNSWNAMRDRCKNPNNQSFKNYGGRGIDVCDSWSKSFQIFYDDMGDRPTPKHTLERADNNKGYSICNCYWADWLDQANNRRSNKRVTVDGVTKTLKQWSEFNNIPYRTIQSRIYKRGWSGVKSVTTHSIGR